MARRDERDSLLNRKLIAATALIHDLTVVTRNVDDFAKTGVRLVNPFAEQTASRRPAKH